MPSILLPLVALLVLQVAVQHQLPLWQWLLVAAMLLVLQVAVQHQLSLWLWLWQWLPFDPPFYLGGNGGNNLVSAILLLLAALAMLLVPMATQHQFPIWLPLWPKGIGHDQFVA